jgi:hypothetical protein
VVVRLFHYTCGDHGFAGIGVRGLLVPRHGRTLGGISHLDWGLVWLTSGGFETTGMDGSGYNVCDRGRYRYLVTDDSKCEPWLESKHRREADVMDGLIDLLEKVGDPECWWVSSEPVPVRLA